MSKAPKKKNAVSPAKFVPLMGSGRTPRPEFSATHPSDPNEMVRVVIKVRPINELPDPDKLGALAPTERPVELTRPQLNTNFGASQADIDAVVAFAKDHKLDVVEADAAQRMVVLSGNVKDVTDAFHTNLEVFKSRATGETYRGREGDLHLPDNLSKIITAVAGLDNRTQAKERSAIRALAVSSSFLPTEVAQAYNFPPGLDGTGQCIGIIEFGGGFSTTDLDFYFQQELGFSKTPSVTAVSVDGTTMNNPGADPNADDEVMLDIEVAGAVAPGAKIAVYFAQFTEAGWLESITKAVHDKLNKPTVLSISWGWAELEDAGSLAWTPLVMEEVNRTLGEAASLGITVIVAAGDDGSSDSFDDGKVHVDFPASSPYVLGCGGTKLVAKANTIVNETVWNDGPRNTGGTTGGGVSEHFPIPPWQSIPGVNIPKSASTNFQGRGVPDVAGNADPNTGYQVRSGGKNGVTGGTSAVAPLWAGLIARINEQLGKLPGANSVGYFNPFLYKSVGPTAAFHDILSGNNDALGTLSGAYTAGPGWDACTGWGSPNGVGLLNALTQTPVAGATVKVGGHPSVNGVLTVSPEQRIKSLEDRVQSLQDSNRQLIDTMHTLVRYFPTPPK